MSAKGQAAKKPATKKASAIVKGAVGFMYGGVLRVGVAHIFYVENEADVTQTYNDARVFLGRYVTCKYIPVENASELFETLKTEIAEQHDSADLYTCYSSALLEKLKEVTGIERCKNLKEKEVDDKDGDKGEEVPTGKKTSTAKAPAPKKGAAEVAEKVPTKKPAAGGKGGKKTQAVVEEVEDEAEEEEEADEEEDDGEEDGEEDVDDVDVEDEDDEEEVEDEEVEEVVAQPPPKKSGKVVTPPKVQASTKTTTTKAPAKAAVTTKAPVKTTTTKALAKK